MAIISVTADQVGEVFPQYTEVMAVKLEEAVDRGQILYQTGTGTFGLADADATGRQQARGVALEKGGAGQVIRMLKRGHVAGFAVSSTATDSRVYLATTPGALDDTAPSSPALAVTCGRVVGLSDGTRVVYFDFDWITQWS